MSTVDTESLLTVRHAAEHIGVVKDTILNMTRDGRLDPVRIDGRIFIRKEQLGPSMKDNRNKQKDTEEWTAQR